MRLSNCPVKLVLFARHCLIKINALILMREYYRKVSKSYQKSNFEIEDGLSTYDLQLLSLGKIYKKKKLIIKDQCEDLLVA